MDIKLTPPLSMALGWNYKEHKEESFFSYVLFAVKENYHGGTETRRREKSISSYVSVTVKAFMAEGDKPSS